MINLLSPKTKKNIRAARRNVQLRKYVVLVFIATIGTMAIYGIGFYTVMADQSRAEMQLNKDEAAKRSYAQVLSTAKEYKNNLKVASKVLSAGIVYSDFLIQTAQALPADSVLTDLSLSAAKASTTTTAVKADSIVLNARSATYGAALQVKNNLENSTLFENVNLSSITMQKITAESSALERKYPFTLVINVTVSTKRGSL